MRQKTYRVVENNEHLHPITDEVFESTTQARNYIREEARKGNITSDESVAIVQINQVLRPIKKDYLVLTVVKGRGRSGWKYIKDICLHKLK